MTAINWLRAKYWAWQRRRSREKRARKFADLARQGDWREIRDQASLQLDSERMERAVEAALLKESNYLVYRAPNPNKDK